MKKLICVGLAVGLLSACNATQPLAITTGPTTVAFNKAAPKERIRDEVTTTTIRAFQPAKTEDGKDTRVELAGAECSLTSDHFNGKVVTPQVVQLPKYDQNAKLKDRGVPPSILVKCKKGKLKGQQLLTAKPGQIVSGSGNLVVDLILIAGSAAAAASADWKYAPAVVVILK